MGDFICWISRCWYVKLYVLLWLFPISCGNLDGCGQYWLRSSLPEVFCCLSFIIAVNCLVRIRWVWDLWFVVKVHYFIFFFFLVISSIHCINLVLFVDFLVVGCLPECFIYCWRVWFILILIFYWLTFFFKYGLFVIIVAIIVGVYRSEVSINFFVSVRVIHLRRCLLFPVVSIFFAALALTSFVFPSLILLTHYYAEVLGFCPVMSDFLIVWFIEWCKLIDVVLPLVYLSTRFVQLLHDDGNLHCFCLPGWLLLKLLGSLRFNVSVDAGSLIGGCVGYQVMNQSKYCGINWVLFRPEYSAYWCQITCGVDDKFDNDCLMVSADRIVVRIVVSWVVVIILDW